MKMNAIEIRELSKSFVSERGKFIHVLDRLNFNVSENDFICIVGPSGCGKTTLLKIIAGLDNGYEGAVTYRGRRLSAPTREIGMVFQEYSLLPWRTVLDNVALGPELGGHPRSHCITIARKYLELVGLQDFAGSYPHELSGGMQQRAAIARALANNPDVLLMDEPFGALDAHTRILLQKELLRIWERHRKTILFVTHSVDEAIYLADSIHVLSIYPACIKETIEVNLPRPRDRANPLFGELTARILAMLEENGALSKYNHHETFHM